MPNHALLSASSSHRWLHCPPSARLCEGYDDTGSNFAAEGTDAHALCEYNLRTVLGMEAQDPTEDLSWYDAEMEECANSYAQFFIGNSFLNPLTDPKGGLFAANVTFEPGCRNNWHIHHADKGGGQLLICTAGEGWYQEEGKAAVSLHEGSVVMIPANVKHWHGAKKDSWFSHIAVEVPGEHCKNVWCEPVSDEEYAKL